MNIWPMCQNLIFYYKLENIMISSGMHYNVVLMKNTRLLNVNIWADVRVTALHGPVNPCISYFI